MFNPDRPITNKESDLLGRKDFALKLAQAMNLYNDTDSIVIGLYGPWGSGKTSLLNMVIEYVEENDQTVVLKFNPWSYSDQNDLFLQYFKALSTKFKRLDTANRFKKIGELIETYSYFFEPLKLLPDYSLKMKLASSLTKWLGKQAKNVADRKSSDIDGIKKQIDNELTKLVLV